jgi:hypothetical protein
VKIITPNVYLKATTPGPSFPRRGIVHEAVRKI